MVKSALRIAGEADKALPKRLAFTVDSLGRVHCPERKKRIYVYDTRQPALAFCRTETGAGTFYVVKKTKYGKTVRARLGPFPTMSIEQARKLAPVKAVEIHNGANPAQQKREAREAATVGDVWKDWCANIAAQHRERTRKTDESRFRTCLKELEGRKLATLNRTDVAALHRRIGQKRGRVTANRAIQLLRRLVNYAADIGVKDIDPKDLTSVRLFGEQERERYLSAAELPKLFAAIDAEEPMFRNFFKLALFTGARRGNVQAMRWEHIETNAKTWTIPGAEAKRHKTMTIALCPEAMAILEERLKDRMDETPWVFPTRSVTGHLTEPKTAWARILKRSGLSDLHIHDLRRTMASWQAALGTSLPIIGKSLGHGSIRSTQIYARLDLDPVRQSVGNAVAAMVAAAKPPAKPADTTSATTDADKAGG